MAGQALLRWIAGKALGLPPRRSGRLAIERDLAVPMRDATVLLADRYYLPDDPTAPVVLMRSPYGRSGMFGMLGALLAERGFQVVAQSVRGTAGSGGTINPMRQEKDDGADTIDWVRAQPWFSGKLYGFGGSYLGNVLWAMAAAAPNRLDGLSMSVTLSNFRDELLGFGGYTQGGTLAWTQTMQAVTQPAGTKRPRRGSMPKLDHAHAQLPVGAIDQAAFGKQVTWWQDWTSHDPEDPWWQAMDYSAAVPALAAPVSMVAGWQDIFLPHQLRDFTARQAAGRPVWLTIGPWTHAAPGGMIAGLKDAIATFSALHKGKPPHTDRGRVRLFLQEAGEWRDYPTWPPPRARTMTLHLRGGGRLDAEASEDDEGLTGFVYDPADPTPALHGPQLMASSRKRDMSALEAREDTISFTSDPLEADLDAIGPVTAELTVRSDRAHTDFFVCLCDVDAKGLPKQVCDGYLRLRPGKPAADADGVRRITIECWPTAYRFRRGHRLRLIIASGAHPRFARNLGTGEPLSTGTAMVIAHQEVLHGKDYPSRISLTVVPEG